jgi:hypothetical protein
MLDIVGAVLAAYGGSTAALGVFWLHIHNAKSAIISRIYVRRAYLFRGFPNSII